MITVVVVPFLCWSSVLFSLLSYTDSNSIFSIIGSTHHAGIFPKSVPNLLLSLLVFFSLSFILATRPARSPLERIDLRLYTGELKNCYFYVDYQIRYTCIREYYTLFRNMNSCLFVIYIKSSAGYCHSQQYR